MNLIKQVFFFAVIAVTNFGFAGQTSKPTVWILATELVGEMNGMMATAKKMDAEIIVIEMPQSLKDAEKRKTFTVDANLLNSEVAQLLRSLPKPDFVFNCLSRTAKLELVAEIKRQYSKPYFVNFYDPISRRSLFDFVVNSSHLDPVPHDGLIEVDGVPSIATTVDLKTLSEPKLIPGDRPVVAVLIGGKAKDSDLTVESADYLATILNQLHEKYNLRFIVTNSRRTSAEVWSAFKQRFTAPYLEIDWQNPNPNTGNPYLSVLSQANYFVVTGDSMSMISDAVSTGKPTYIFAPPKTLEPRHKRLILKMAETGRVRPLSLELSEWYYEPLDSAAQAATQILANAACDSWFTRATK